MIRLFHLFFLAIIVGIFVPVIIWAEADLLDLSTRTDINPEGLVTIRFEIRNRSDKPLFKLKPMFHFHHAMSGMPMIQRLDPGESHTFINKNHPRVLRAGRYPLIVKVQYRLQPDSLSSSSIIQNLMDSFYFKEELRSAVKGKLEFESVGQESMLKIFLTNKAQSFKNIRLMLLLPPGLTVHAFDQGMLGFTIRGGEEKEFGFPVTREEGFPGGNYPVYLMIEYGEMQKHYSDEVFVTMQYVLSWEETPFWNHILTFCAFALFLFWIYRTKQKEKIRSSKVGMSS